MARKVALISGAGEDMGRAAALLFSSRGRAGVSEISEERARATVEVEDGYDQYTASKGGVIALTRSLAQYYARFGVRRDALMLGSIETAISRVSLTDPGCREYSEPWRILGRRAQAEEVARAAPFLASDESSVITGCILWPEAGWMLGPLSDRLSPV